MKTINVKCVFTGASKDLTLHTRHHAIEHPFNANNFLITDLKDDAGFPLSFAKNHFIII